MNRDELFQKAFSLKMEGERLFREGKEEEAAACFEEEYALLLPLAEAGHARAMMTLAELLQGRRVAAARETDDPVAEAVALWERAAEAGDSRGYTNIGLLYLHEPVPGGGEAHGAVPYDPAQAFAYFLRAFELGDSKAGRHVGRCYRYGWGVEQCPEKAFFYFTEAAKRNDSTARLFRADCLYRGYGVEQDVPRAVREYRELAGSGGHDAAAGAQRLREILGEE